MHKNSLTNGQLDRFKKYLPTKESNIGRQPSMGTKDLELRYNFPFLVDYLNNELKAQLMGFAIKAAVRFLFKKFVYTFGGKMYRQMSGGPIRARLTMAVARLVIGQWKDEYNTILRKSNIKELSSGLYMDDGRTVHRKLKLGEWFDKSKIAIIFKEEQREQDIKENLTGEEVTRREILNAMNSVNADLTFTMEICQDFDNGRIPTLSFSLWPGKARLMHSYFEKHMRNQMLVMERTAMGRQAVMSIMTNELTRRLQVLDEKLVKTEVIAVIDKYVQQLKKCGFNWKQTRDIVVSSIKGRERKEKLRKKKNIPRYRTGKQSLDARVSKKLTEKYKMKKVKKKKKYMMKKKTR